MLEPHFAGLCTALRGLLFLKVPWYTHHKHSMKTILSLSGHVSTAILPDFLWPLVCLGDHDPGNRMLIIINTNWPELSEFTRWENQSRWHQQLLRLYQQPQKSHVAYMSSFWTQKKVDVTVELLYTAVLGLEASLNNVERNMRSPGVTEATEDHSLYAGSLDAMTAPCKIANIPCVHFLTCLLKIKQIGNLTY